MTVDFVKEVMASEDVIYFPFCDWLFPNGLKINNVLFTIPWFNDTSIEVYWYGFLIAFGMLLAVIYVSSRVRKFGLEPDRVLDVVLAGLVGGIIGARAYYVIFRLNELYLTDEGGLDIPKVLNIRDGGLAVYGGVIGALIFGGIVAMIRRVKISPMLDLTGLGLLIGQCIGRWGNFFNQEAFGSKTTLPWGMTSNTILNRLYFFYHPDDNVVVTNQAREMVAHPCFFYESLWCLIGFLILHFYSKKFRKFDGEIFLLYIGWYGAGRFWIEALRTDSLYIPGTPFKVSQVVAGTCVIFSIVLLTINYINIKKHGYTFYYETEESKALLKDRADKHVKVDADAELTEHILADDAADNDTDAEAPAEAPEENSEEAAEDNPEEPEEDRPAGETPEENAEPETEPEAEPEADKEGTDSGSAD